MLLLQILGGIVLALVIVAATTYLYYRFKFGKYLDMDTTQEPLTIHLTEDVAPDWLDNKTVKPALDELFTLGFKKGAAYSIHEMDGYFLQAFFKPPIVAVLYWHNVAGCWVDMVVEEIGGKEYTFSNAPMGAGIEQRPESKKNFRKEASIKELYEGVSVFSGQDNISYVKIDSINFRGYFESTYKKDISWKNRKGGISYDEFVRSAGEAPFSSKEKNILDAFIETKESELHQWEEAALDEYRKTGNIEEDEFYELERKLIIVPFMTDATAFIRYLECKGFVSEQQSDKLGRVYSEETDIYSLFDKINNLLSPELRAEYVEELNFPLNIKVYQMNEGMVN